MTMRPSPNRYLTIRRNLPLVLSHQRTHIIFLVVIQLSLSLALPAMPVLYARVRMNDSSSLGRSSGNQREYRGHIAELDRGAEEWGSGKAESLIFFGRKSKDERKRE